MVINSLHEISHRTLRHCLREGALSHDAYFIVHIEVKIVSTNLSCVSVSYPDTYVVFVVDDTFTLLRRRVFHAIIHTGSYVQTRLCFNGFYLMWAIIKAFTRDTSNSARWDA